MTEIALSESGLIRVTTGVDEACTIVETYYPLCGDAVETTLVAGTHVCRVRPDTYTQATSLDTE